MHTLSLAMHSDENWRLTDKATNCWMGLVDDSGGDEVIDLTRAAVIDFDHAFHLAQKVVEYHNATVLVPA